VEHLAHLRHLPAKVIQNRLLFIQRGAQALTVRNAECLAAIGTTKHCNRFSRSFQDHPRHFKATISALVASHRHVFPRRISAVGNVTLW
jgi:hypothetical protein